ncbi:PqqD family protein [Stella sp.]|uniref:PqqD family protein n=1 Tax=Stella sp. TaxID=2912054 RepID=UPI0035B13CE8
MDTTLPLHVRINREEIAHDVIDGEVILINTLSGFYYSLRGSAVALWGEIEDGRSVDDLRAWAAGQYGLEPAAAADAVDGFVAGLVADRVLLPADGPAAPADVRRVPPPAPGEAFAAPVIERFTEMQDLLTLDPIHEVDDLGWPHAARPPA